MAGPEIRQTASVKDHGSSNLSDSEKSEVGIVEGTLHDVHATPAKLDSNTTIAYHYLTFETPLPVPSITYNASDDGEAHPTPPEQPDMRKYISPYLWSESRKNYTIYISCIATSITAYVWR